MATLSEVSGIARKGIKWGTIVLIILALIPGILRLIKAIYGRLNPPPPPPPTVRYGKLPELIFPRGSNVKLTYKLETIEGGLPALENTAKVYIVGINKSRLVTLDRVRDKLQQLGFINNPVELNEQSYKFVHPKIPAEAIANVVSGGFAYKFDWTREPNLAGNHSMPKGPQAISEARGFFQRLDLLRPDLQDGIAKVTYLIASGSAMIPSSSIYDANFVRVDLFRADKDKLRVVAAGGDTSPVAVILSGLRSEKSLIQANYHYSQIVGEDFATYPLKPVDTAWKELQEGEGYVAKRTGDSVVVRRIYLGYYESDEPQQFFQPVYVFEGDGFLGYIQAVHPSYLQ